jgi:anti-sigma B factor antagonist
MGIFEGDHVQLLQWEQDVTLKNTDEFRRAVLKLLHSDKSKLILGLKDVVYLNSAALGVIAEAVLSSVRNGKELIIASVEPTIEEIFKIVHFGTFMKIFIELEEAFTYYHE